MKLPSLAFLVIVASATSTFAQDVANTGPSLASDLAPATARILGDIPDGTPPTPEPPKPGFIVPAKDVLEIQTHRQAGRMITIRKIKPIDLPPPPQSVPANAKISPEIQARIDAYRAARPLNTIIHLGASVYRSENSVARSWVTFWPGGDEKQVTFWSSADFSLLSGIASFVDSKGAARSLWMVWTAFEGTDPSKFELREGQSDPSRMMPGLPAGKATFAITSGNPSAQALATVQSLHDLYQNEHERLKAAFEGRERARSAQEAYLKANPPQPMDITLNYWRTEKPAICEKGGDK